MKTPYVVQDYTGHGTRIVRLRIDLPNEPGRRDYFTVEVSRYGGNPFTVEIVGYGSVPVEHAVAYMNLLGTAIDLARRLNENPESSPGLPTASV